MSAVRGFPSLAAIVALFCVLLPFCARSVTADTQGHWTTYQAESLDSSPTVAACSSVISEVDWYEGACIQLPKPIGVARDNLRNGFLPLYARHYCTTSGGTARQYVYKDSKCEELSYVEEFPVALQRTGSCIVDRAVSCPNPSGTVDQPDVPPLQVTICTVADSADLTEESCATPRNCIRRYYEDDECAHIDLGDAWFSYKLACSTPSPSVFINSTLTLTERAQVALVEFDEYSSSTYDPLGDPYSACSDKVSSTHFAAELSGECAPFFDRSNMAAKITCANVNTGAAQTLSPTFMLIFILSTLVSLYLLHMLQFFN